MMLSNIMFEADIHLRLLYTFILDMKFVCGIGMLSEGHMVATLCHYTGQIGPRFGKSASLEAT